MRKVNGHFFTITLLALLMLFFTEFVLGNDAVFVTDSAIVSKESRNLVIITDINTGKDKKRQFDKKIDIIEISPKEDYFIFYYENDPMDNYIFDIKRDSINYFGLRANSNVWSKNGNHVVYVYANRIDIISTENIENYLKKKTAPFLTIKSINDISTLTFLTWLGNHKIIFYDSTGEKIKFYIYDILKQKKHFINECLFNQDGCKKDELNSHNFIINKIKNALKNKLK